MVVKSEVICRGEAWHTINQELVGPFFETLWDAFKLCTSIGILYDIQLDDDSNSEEKAEVPRTMFGRYAEEVSFFFKAAILTTSVVDLSEKDRLYLAFSEDVLEEEMEGEDREVLLDGVSEEAKNFNKILFLKKFANYGALRIFECISKNESETMENIMEFLDDSYHRRTEELIEMTKVSDDDEVWLDADDE